MKCECESSGFCPRRNCEVGPARWRLCQIPLPEHAPPQRPSNVFGVSPKADLKEVTGSKIGTYLEQIFKERVGAGTPCGGCQAAIRILNGLNPDQATDQLNTIVADIISRAGSKAPKWWQRVAIYVDQKLGTGQTEHWIRERVLEAIDKARADVRVKEPPAQSKKKSRGFFDPVTPVDLSAPVRHLNFHLWPLKDPGVWLRHLDYLQERIHLFNGYKIISVALDKNTASMAEVLQECDKRGIHWDHQVVSSNRGVTGETHFWKRKMEWFITQREVKPEDIMFYCHSKGVRERTNTFAIWSWIDMMYRSNLDYIELAQQQLQTHLFTGSFKKYGAYRFPGNHRWHYSGTFYWMQMFGLQKRKPGVVEPRYVGTEAFPGFKAKTSEAAAIFCDATPHSLYDEPSIRKVILPLWNEWQRENETCRNTGATDSSGLDVLNWRYSNSADDDHRAG